MGGGGGWGPLGGGHDGGSWLPDQSAVSCQLTLSTSGRTMDPYMWAVAPCYAH